MKPPIEVLKSKLLILKLEFRKSIDDYEKGLITEDQHLEQEIKISFQINQYKKAIEILENHKYVKENIN